MDDWIVITHARWKRRSAVCTENETLNLLKVEQHPDKTFIGRVERGFDSLGYFIKPGVSRGTFERFTERISRLYEHGADYVCIGEYVRDWLRWVRTGVNIVYCNLRGGGAERISPYTPGQFTIILTDVLCYVKSHLFICVELIVRKTTNKLLYNTFHLTNIAFEILCVSVWLPVRGKVYE